LGCHTSVPLGAEGWCQQDALIIWQVHTALRPDPSWGSEGYLRLEVGETLVLQQRYDGEWNGWGIGKRWGEQEGEGIFHLSHVKANILLSREPEF